MIQQRKTARLHSNKQQTRTETERKVVIKLLYSRRLLK